MTTKSYANDDISVIWKPDLCIHSAKCVEGLPKVFDPDRKPWIDPKAATTDAIIAQVRKCPSGALSYETKGQPAGGPVDPLTETVAVEATRNGPLIVRGSHQLTGSDGKSAAKTGAVAYCRCGQSSRKPFCDGTHTKVGFKG